MSSKKNKVNTTKKNANYGTSNYHSTADNSFSMEVEEVPLNEEWAEKVGSTMEGIEEGGLSSRHSGKGKRGVKRGSASAAAPSGTPRNT